MIIRLTGLALLLRAGFAFAESLVRIDAPQGFFSFDTFLWLIPLLASIVLIIGGYKLEMANNSDGSV